ncbi:uncharacterized protein LOC113212180 [Frankliniella occidentalis]|uniref:Uncharacterized protein LOC113212180 n=1 Tax=Frankliniella occidentalis TaxID=133901 RepID=A0A6J1T047_FRAOC|nr:uncharacterized protein LOC113212180 [Frankliniella occidentalis]
MVVTTPPTRSRSEPEFDVCLATTSTATPAPAPAPTESSFSLGLARCLGVFQRQASDPQPSASAAKPSLWRQASDPAPSSTAEVSRQPQRQASVPEPTPVTSNGRRAADAVPTPPIRRQVSDPVVPTCVATPPIRRQASDPVPKPTPTPSPVSILRPPGTSTPRRHVAEQTRVTISVPVETHAPPRSPQRPSLTRSFKEELRTSSL